VTLQQGPPSTACGTVPPLTEIADNHADGETSNMNGVGDMPPAMSQSLSGMSGGDNMANIMSQSMQVTSGTAPNNLDIMTSSTSSLNMGPMGEGGSAKPRGRSAGGTVRNKTSQNWFAFEEAENTEDRADSAAKEREREEKVRRIRDQQEDERKKKLEELKQHALSAQKFREQQETEIRKRIEGQRFKDMDRRQQVEERRRDIERAERDRRESIIQKNRDRDGKLETQRKNSRSNIDFAFGSSAPRLIEPRIDSSSSGGYWGSRSTIGPGMFDRRSAERDQASHEARVKRTTSAQGLDRSTEGDEAGLADSVFNGAPAATAHRRRTDLVPTIVMSRSDMLGGTTSRPNSSRGVNTPGISRENSTTGSRPGSALSAPRPSTGGVKMRVGGGARRPRPLSIATTGMTASMYEERQKPAHVPRNKSSATPKLDRIKRARSVTSDTGGIDDDNRSTTSSQSVGPANRTPTRKTPSQVKAEAAARKAKATGGRGAAGSTPKSSLGSRGAGAGGASGASKSPSPALSQDQLDVNEDKENKVRQSTPDIIKDNSTKRDVIAPPVDEVLGHDNSHVDVEVKEPTPPVKEPTPPVKEPTPPVEQSLDDNTKDGESEVKEKTIITSEEEAKAKIAEKRRLMKEQKEREAELERQRLEEEARLEEEQRIREEEEERLMIEEADRMAAEQRRQEEERIRKAIEEKDEEDRRVREEEERLKREKEELEKKTKEEAEKREVELKEKLRKEEEERLARKKRIADIMARTRGPKKEPEPEPQPQPPPPQEVSQPASLDSHVDPTKPDLLGDISYEKVESAENAKNLMGSSSSSSSSSSSEEGDIPSPSSPTEPELEKGALDSISNKSVENDDSSSPLITMENGGGPIKKSNGVVDGGVFDQILDLGNIPDSNKVEGINSQPPNPIIAFEENITPSNTTADLLS